MSRASYTSSDSFAHRVQRAEQCRALVMIIVLAVMLTLYIVRRLTGGVVMAENHIFFSIVFVLLGAVAFETFSVFAMRAANRAGRLIEPWKWRVAAVVELLVPVAILTAMQIWSPRGHVAALSPPALLLFPLVVLLSILHLREAFTLWTGLGAAAAHLGLTIYAIAVSDPPIDLHVYPVLFSYPVVLTLIAVAGALTAREVRGYVREALLEAAAREKSDRRVEMVEHDLNVAREIQKGLLPRSAPDVPGFEFAGVSEPADLTGGDYYDWQTLPDGRIAVVLADVTGHGVGPAIVMAVCRAYARATAPLMPDLTPLLGRLNDLIHADVHGDRFITFVIAVVDPKKSEVEILSAGHGPSLMHRHADGAVERFGGDGLPLGVTAGEEYGESRRITLAPGDSILLLTDGYFEWRRESDNQQFGIPRLTEVFSKAAGLDAKATLKRLDDAVRAFVGPAKQEDDMTAVVIRRV